jgi:adenylosuccinate synthase
MSGEVAAAIGTNWGDEGKGKVVNYLARMKGFGYLARGTGGNNAGHTFWYEGKEYKFNLMPCDPFGGKPLALGRCMVIDPNVLYQEVTRVLEKTGNYPDLRIDGSASIIMDWHKVRDVLMTKGIGTTGRGIGPCYEDRRNRLNDITYYDLHDDERFESRVADVHEYQKKFIEAFGGSIEPPRKITEKLAATRSLFRRYKPADISLEIRDVLKEGKNVLLEGAQGFHLSVDHGTRPYVTSSEPGILGLLSGVGLGPHDVKTIIGVTKAYTTRVGEGPMPTLQGQEFNEIIRGDKRGSEYGATTGRPRRSGWLDLPMLRHAVRKNNITDIAMTKVDVLDNFHELKVCTGYLIDGDLHEEPPSDPALLGSVTPVYKPMKGWGKLDWKSVVSSGNLPKELKDYIGFVEDDTGVDVSILSCGPEPEMTIERYAII